MGNFRINERGCGIIESFERWIYRMWMYQWNDGGEQQVKRNKDHWYCIWDVFQTYIARADGLYYWNLSAGRLAHFIVLKWSDVKILAEYSLKCVNFGIKWIIH